MVTIFIQYKKAAATKPPSLGGIHYMKNKFIEANGIVAIQLSGKIFTTIDAKDLPRAQQFPGTWGVVKNTNTSYTRGALYYPGGVTQIYLHRYTMQCPEGFVVDHINHNGLDNTRKNLRIVTQAENLQNLCGARSTSKSGSRNTFFDKYFDKWVAEVAVNGKVVYKKRYEFREDAEVAAAMARLKYQPFSPEGTAARMTRLDYPKVANFVTYALDV